MKRSILLILVLFLVGCSDQSATVKDGLVVRQRILESSGCEFDAVISANYSDCSYVFTLRCEVDTSGDLFFTVMDPESISGISGRITDTGGDLLFDDVVLGFDPVAQGLISPVGAPWLFMKTLRGGYLHACEKKDASTVLILDDSYRGENIRTHILISEDRTPTFCELYWQGKRYLSMDVKNFVFV